MEPLVPLAEVDELVFDAVDSVLVKDLVDSSSKSFRVSVRQFLLVVEKYPRMVVFVMQWLEIFRVIRQDHGIMLATPRDQFGISCVFTEPVFRLFDIVSAFPEKSFEDPTDVFVK